MRCGVSLVFCLLVVVLSGCQKSSQERPTFGAVPTRVHYSGQGDRAGEELALELSYNEVEGRLQLDRVLARAKWLEGGQGKEAEWTYRLTRGGQQLSISVEGQEHEALLPVGEVVQWVHGVAFYAEGRGQKLGYTKGLLVWYEGVKDGDTVRESYYDYDGVDCQQVVRQCVKQESGVTSRRQFEVRISLDAQALHPFGNVGILHLMPLHRLGLGRLRVQRQLPKLFVEREVEYQRYDTVWHNAQTALSTAKAVERLRFTKVEYRENGFPSKLTVHWLPEGGEQGSPRVDVVTFEYNK